MNFNRKALALGIAGALASVAAIAPAPASASCTTTIILGQRTCLESIPCQLRDAAVNQAPEKVQATAEKWANYDCVQ